MKKVQKVFCDWKIEENYIFPMLELFNESGETVFSYSIFRKVTFKDVIAQYSNKHQDCSNVEGRSKRFTNLYGITPSNVARLFNSYRHRFIFNHHSEWFSIIRAKSTNIVESRFLTIEYEDKVKQAIKDGLKNITPLILLCGKDPKGLKEMLGSSLWKKLCKNSYSRNRLIFFNVERLKNIGYGYDRPQPFDIKKSLEDANKIQSTFLRDMLNNNTFQFSKSFWTVAKIIPEFKGVPLTKIKQQPNYKKFYEICVDAERLAREMNVRFDRNWSFRRIEEEHDNLSKAHVQWSLMKLSEKEAKYARLANLNFKDLFEGLKTRFFESGVIAEPLLNMKDVIEEGNKMRHCVSSYAVQSAEGFYNVWHLSKNTKKSTLGIRVKNKEFFLDQHYGPCNQKVEDEDFIEAASEIVKHLNLVNKKQTNPVQ